MVMYPIIPFIVNNDHTSFYIELVTSSQFKRFQIKSKSTLFCKNDPLFLQTNGSIHSGTTGSFRSVGYKPAITRCITNMDFPCTRQKEYLVAIFYNSKSFTIVCLQHKSAVCPFGHSFGSTGPNSFMSILIHIRNPIAMKSSILYLIYF